MSENKNIISVFKSRNNILDILDTYISQSKFPPLDMIKDKKEFVGYKIKDMIYNQFYFLKKLFII